MTKEHHTEIKPGLMKHNELIKNEEQTKQLGKKIAGIDFQKVLFQAVTDTESQIINSTLKSVNFVNLQAHLTQHKFNYLPEGQAHPVTE